VEWGGCPRCVWSETGFKPPPPPTWNIWKHFHSKRIITRPRQEVPSPSASEHQSSSGACDFHTEPWSYTNKSIYYHHYLFTIIIIYLLSSLSIYYHHYLFTIIIIYLLSSLSYFIFNIVLQRRWSFIMRSRNIMCLRLRITMTYPWPSCAAWRWPRHHGRPSSCSLESPPLRRQICRGSLVDWRHRLNSRKRRNVNLIPTLCQSECQNYNNNNCRSSIHLWPTTYRVREDSRTQAPSSPGWRQTDGSQEPWTSLGRGGAESPWRRSKASNVGATWRTTASCYNRKFHTIMYNGNLNLGIINNNNKYSGFISLLLTRNI